MMFNGCYMILSGRIMRYSWDKGYNGITYNPHVPWLKNIDQQFSQKRGWSSHHQLGYIHLVGMLNDAGRMRSPYWMMGPQVDSSLT